MNYPLVKTVLTGLLVLAAASSEQQDQPHRQPVFNRPPLQPNAFAPLPLGSIHPQGWLKRQLQIQADGLSGHLDEFWPDLGPNSGWLGGKGESWERGPYYMDGLVPLAFLLEDEKLIAKAKKWVEWTLANPRPDGAIGPNPKLAQYAQRWQATDWWPNMVMLKVLTQYYEATGDKRVVPLMSRYLHYHLARAAKIPLVQWAAYRWAEEVLSIVWLYNRTGDEKLLALARELRKQGYDWKAHFADFRYTNRMEKSQTNLGTHVVNNSMAMKTPAVWWQISGDATDRQAVHHMMEILDRYHGQATGLHSGDEHYAGLDPSQGTELCAVVEAMFSLEQLMAIYGEAAFGDRLERIAFNALPAPFTENMWAHQYDQQVNQVKCSREKNRNWTTNGPDANLFGLEPNFGCCTANMHQGWPKFASHLWMATRDGGLAAVAYAPSVVKARVRGGAEVRITTVTNYPFQEKIRLTIHSAAPVRFPLQLRIPSWTPAAVIAVNGSLQSGVEAGRFFTIEREWKQADTVDIAFPMPLRLERRFRNGVAVLRGPLVFSLPIGQDWKKVGGVEPHADWEVHPTTPWNYALLVDPDQPEATLRVEEAASFDSPFSASKPPLRIRAQVVKVPEWNMVNGSAGPLPASPVRVHGEPEPAVLIPYGAAKLRITVFPEARAGR